MVTTGGKSRNGQGWLGGPVKHRQARERVTRTSGSRPGSTNQWGFGSMTSAAMWSVSDECGQGLLRLPLGWRPGAYRQAMAEITTRGWEIDRHEEFHVFLDGCTYYKLQPTVPSGARKAKDLPLIEV